MEYLEALRLPGLALLFVAPISTAAVACASLRNTLTITKR